MDRRSHTEIIAELAPPAGRDVLDIGCGDGGLVRWLVKHGARAVGIDPGHAALDAAKRNVPEGEFIAAPAENLPFPAARFDTAICLNALHHVPVAAQAAAIAEAARVLKAGGALLVIEPIARGSNFELGRLLDDETHVRDAAYAVLQAPPAALRTVKEIVYDSPIRYENFEAWVKRTTTVDPARAVGVAKHRAELERRFSANSTREDGKFVFQQPTRANLFARV